MSFTNFLNAEALDEIFGQVEMPTWSNLYIALSTGTPDETGGNFIEPGDGTTPGTGYERVTVTNDKIEWLTATITGDVGSLHNRNTITFPTSTGSWETANYFGIFDSGTAPSHLMAFGALTTPQSIGDNNTASFASGTLSVTLN